MSVLKLHTGGCRGKGCFCYVISMKKSSSSPYAVTRKIVVTMDLAERLYWRYSIKVKPNVVAHIDNTSSIAHGADDDTDMFHVLPGLRDSVFLHSLCSSMCRKYSSRLSSTSRTVTPFLYVLWVLTSSITVELFSDSLNDSGVLPAYCSLDYEDRAFGSIGLWEDVEDSVEGAGGNPPFKRLFLQKMVTEFDSGARGTSPYCRCVLLPLGELYGILERTARISSQGIMLVRIPSGCLSFRLQESYFGSNFTTQYHAFQDLGLFIWRNRPYLERNPPPVDVELLYLHWVAVSCRNPSEVSVDIQAIRMTFPPALRKSCCKFNLFKDSLSNEKYIS